MHPKVIRGPLGIAFLMDNQIWKYVLLDGTVGYCNYFEDASYSIGRNGA